MEHSPHCVTTAAVVHVNINAKLQVISSYVVLIVHFFYNSADFKKSNKKVTVKFNENGKKIFKTLATKF